jgi:hypothetical protein
VVCGYGHVWLEEVDEEIDLDITLEEGYAHIAPTDSVWDTQTQSWLAADRRPKGDRAGSFQDRRVDGRRDGHIRPLGSRRPRVPP